MATSVPSLDPAVPTDAELCDICKFLDTFALTLHLRHYHVRGTADYHEYQDAGMAGLEYALRTWTADLSLPFEVAARINIVRRMLRASRDYVTWCYPGDRTRWTKLDRCKPQAEHVAPPAWHEAEQAGDLHGWFHRQIATHRACFTTQAWGTLQDYLQDLDYQEIADRDRIAVQNARLRQARLLTFLRRHVFGQETTCTEEQRCATHSRNSRHQPSCAAAD